jgi:hypothetical protein
MKLKIVLSVLVILCLLGITGYLFYQAVGHTDETSWGSWYQEYQIAYTDGTTAPLSLYHSGKSVDSVEYVLKATVNNDYGTGIFDYSSYHLDIVVNDDVIGSQSFSGSKTIKSSDGETQLVHASLSLDELRSLENGTYAVHFIPRGSIILDDEETILPSMASVMIRVGSIDPPEEPPEEPPEDPSDEKDISFETEVIWY